MHMTMRKYRQVKGTPEDVTAWVKTTLMPVLKTSGGLKAYYAIMFEDGTIGSINVFESEAAANNANVQVRQTVGKSGADMLQHVETKVWEILHEEHAG
jgi:hypothetical protein